MAKKIFLFFFLVSHCLLGQKSTAAWENPEIFGVNKLAPHAHFIPYQDQETALSFKQENSDRYQSLNGAWDFRFYTNPDQTPTDFLVD